MTVLNWTWAQSTAINEQPVQQLSTSISWHWLIDCFLSPWFPSTRHLGLKTWTAFTRKKCSYEIFNSDCEHECYQIWVLLQSMGSLLYFGRLKLSLFFIFRQVTIVNVTWYILSPSSSIKMPYCPAKCFKNKILLYQLTFPRRKTSAVITASISSAPSAKITSALPFKSAMLQWAEIFSTQTSDQISRFFCSIKSGLMKVSFTTKPETLASSAACY